MTPLIVIVLVLAHATVDALPATNPPCFDELQDISAAPTTPLYNATSRVSNPDWNGEAHAQPSFVVLPTTDEHVMRALKCANAAGLRVAIKGGGHSFGGYGSIPADQGFVINFAHMNNVSRVTKSASFNDENGSSNGNSNSKFATVTAQAGARWMDVYQKFKSSGENWVVCGGLCPSVGVVGFTLGGGTGPAARLHGVGVDNVVNFTMVTANGSGIVHASEDSNPDLFWALRGGGGGNFGVVTSMTLKVFPGPDYYSWGTICFGWNDTAAVLTALNTFGPKIDRTVNVDAILNPEGGMCMWVISMLTVNDTRKALEPLMSAISAKPASDNLQDTDCWWEMINSFAILHGYSEYDDDPFYSRNCFIDGLQPGLISSLISLSESPPPAMCDDGHHLISFGGKVKETSPTATAFAWRSTEYMVYTSCSYTEGSDASKQEAISYLNKWEAATKPYCNGGSYVNFIDPLGRKGADKRYYGVNAERLQMLKQVWNPVGAGPLHFPMEILRAGEDEAM